MISTIYQISVDIMYSHGIEAKEAAKEAIKEAMMKAIARLSEILNPLGDITNTRKLDIQFEINTSRSKIILTYEETNNAGAI